MKDQITITKDDFRTACAEEIKRVMETGEQKTIANVLMSMTCTTFAAALTSRLFDKEGNEDGADS